MEKFNYALQEQGRTKEQEKFISRRLVIKIGSSTITGGTENLDVNFMENIASQVSLLFHNGVEAAIICSGAVAAGKRGLEKVDESLRKQVSAMFGQPDLIAEWQEALNKKGIKKVGQLLATDNSLEFMSSVLRAGLPYGVTVVNGYDSVSDYKTEQQLISNDNDLLSGSIAKSINADTLLLLTDVDGVLDKNRRVIDFFDSSKEVAIFSSSTNLGTGGMSSKIKVAREFVGRAIIANGRAGDVILKVARGEKIGTQFH